MREGIILLLRTVWRLCSQDRIEGAAGAPRQDDVLLSVDDELDAHPAMLPLVQLMERGAALWEQVRSFMSVSRYVCSQYSG